MLETCVKADRTVRRPALRRCNRRMQLTLGHVWGIERRLDIPMDDWRTTYCRALHPMKRSLPAERRRDGSASVYEPAIFGRHTAKSKTAIRKKKFSIRKYTCETVERRTMIAICD